MFLPVHIIHSERMTMRLMMTRYTTSPLLLLLSLLLMTIRAEAQPVADGDGRVGIGTFEPDPAAILDLTSTTMGLLTPRMTTAERDAIVNPPNGLLIYNTDNNSFEHFTGAPTNAWVTMLDDGNVAMQVWLLGGNPGITPTIDFLGTTDNNAMEIHVDEAGFITA